MRRDVRVRFWVEAGLAGLSLALAVLTTFTREWIEIVFRVDPDGGSGALEWALVAALAAASVLSALLARGEWLRARPAT